MELRAPKLQLLGGGNQVLEFIDGDGTRHRFFKDSAGWHSPIRQARHVRGPAYKGGGYFETADDAQRVLHAFHDGSAEILGLTKAGNVVVKYKSVTGINNNPGAGFIDQPTNVFFIKGTSRPSVVPYNPEWKP